MMKRPRLSRPFCITLLALAVVLVLSYHPLSRIRAASTGATILPSAGKPLVNFKTTQSLKVSYVGDADAVAALRRGFTNPTALAAADFNADGAMDVVAGYSISSSGASSSGSSIKTGGALVLFHGNPDAFAPTDQTVYGKAILQGKVPPTFLSKASAFALPESPDLLVTGDFNRDGKKDVLVAARGSSNLYLLAGDGTGNLLAPQAVPVLGEIRALAATEDGHVAVSIDGQSGSQLAILDPSAQGLTAGATYPLPARGDSVAWGHLGGGLDVAVGAGSNVVMVYSVLTANAQTETVTVPFQVQGLTVGDFIWDRDNRTEISLLADDGSIHILQHGTLNTTPLTAAELPARRAAIRGHHAKSTIAPNPTALGAWTIATKLPYAGSAPSGPVSASAFNSPRLANSSTPDLMVLDGAASQLHILDTSGKTASPSADVSFSATPVAALVTPQKINAARDIVVLTSSQAAPTLVTADTTLTLNVNTTADIDTINACTTSTTSIPSTLSLREAVCLANNIADSPTTINVPSGTYDLTSLETGEIRIETSGTAYTLTINGAGSSNTIIQQTDGVDRIFEEDYDLAGNNPVTIENVTLTGSTCSNNSTNDCGDGGGAVIAGGIAGDDLTVTNVVMSNNGANPTATTMNQDNGGAISFETPGGMTVTNSTFSNNVASGAGGAIDFSSGDSGGSISITNSTFTNNTNIITGGAAAIQVYGGFTAAITGSTFTGNKTTESAGDGGALGVITEFTTDGDGTFTMSNSRIVGNSAGISGGGTGLYIDDITATVNDNWWGCNAGPNQSGCDSILQDNNGTDSAYTPSNWLVLSISANPTQIATDGTVTLTANLATNNLGGTGFNVPDGTSVAFGGTLDSSINPTTTTLTNGLANSTYTAGNTTGTGTGTANVDNQTVSVNIDIGAPPTITSASSTTFTLGAAGSFTVTTTGTPTPSISQSGTLPNGVSFHDNGNGTGTLSGTPTQTGTFNTITFTASNGFTPNATQSFTLNVSPASTSISVTNVSPASEVYGLDSAVTITAVLSWTGTGPSPTASDVTIGGNGPSGYSATSCGSPSGDTLTCTATYTPTAADTVGSYTESASFSGDSNYTGSSSTQTGNFSITQATSSTSVGSSQNPSNVGQSVTFTATISGENGLIVRRNGALLSGGVSKRTLPGLTQKGSAHPLTVGGITGTVTWSTNTGCSPSAVSGDPGTSQCTTTTLPQGTDTITATYSGDTNHSGSTGTLSGGQVVNSVVTATSIAVTNVSPASEVYGLDSAVTITAVLSWTGTGPSPTASDVTIGGNGPSGYSATTCGSPVGDTLTCTATYTPTAADPVGTYTESASFSGDSNYTSSSSTQTNNFSITQATSSTSVGSSQNPSNVGQSVTFTATIDGQFGLIVRRNGALLSSGVSKRGLPALTQKGSVHPLSVGGITGTVTWSTNTGCSPSAVSGDPGTSQCTTTTLPQGTDTITATYSGDTNHSGSTGTLSGGQVVNGRPMVNLKPVSVNFGTVHLGTSHTDAITVTNTGGATLNFTKISLTEAAGNSDSFTFVNSCGSTLAPTKSCTITIGFSANKIGSSSATLNIADNAASSPQHVPLSATVINPRASLNPQSLNFGTHKVDSSTVKNVTLTNNGTTMLSIISIAITGADEGDFSQTNTCPSSLNAGDKCTIAVTFDPQATGARSAGLTVTDNALASSETVSLSGTGD